MEYPSDDNILKDLKQSKFLPVYILYGDEPYFIDTITDFIENNILDEAQKAFNQSILYGRDVDVKQILDHARQFPMMSDRRVVIVKEAQTMKDLKALDTYMKSPSPQTILVIAHKKKLDGRIKWIKDAKKSEEIGMLNAQPIAEYRMSKWIKEYVRSAKLKISESAVEMMTQHLGTDLKKIANEIEKIKVNLKSGGTIDVTVIEKYVGISREFDVYALLKAMSKGDIEKVQQIVINIEENEKNQPLQMIIPGMAAYFEKVIIVSQNFTKDDRSLGSMIGAYSSFVKEYRDMASRFGAIGLIKIYSLLVRADAQSKGLDKRKSDGILKELIGKILLFEKVA